MVSPPPSLQLALVHLNYECEFIGVGECPLNITSPLFRSSARLNMPGKQQFQNLVVDSMTLKGRHISANRRGTVQGWTCHPFESARLDGLALLWVVSRLERVLEILKGDSFPFLACEDCGGPSEGGDMLLEGSMVRDGCHD